MSKLTQFSFEDGSTNALKTILQNALDQFGFENDPMITLSTSDDLKNALDQLNSEDYFMVNYDCSIDPDKVQTYLDSIEDASVRAIIARIIKETRYISFTELFEQLNKCIDIFLKRYDKFNLVIKDKSNSELWMIILVWKRIRKGCQEIILVKNYGNISANNPITFDNEYPILEIDDCLYSGCNMQSFVDNVCLRNNPKNDFVIVLPYATTAHTFIQELTQNNVDVIIGEIIQPFEFEEDFEYIYENLGCETLWVCAIYFPHKIANEFASFPNIYPNIVRNQPSREKVIQVYQDLKNLL